MIRNWLQPLGLLALLAAATTVAMSSTAVGRQQVQASSNFQCARLEDSDRSTWNPELGRVTLNYRTDLPASAPSVSRPWLGTFEQDWEAYMAAVLAEIRASGVDIAGERVVMPQAAPWWVAPGMDYETSGRDYINGLTKERGPDPGDLGPGSKAGPQVWAVGFYNTEGAAALRQVFADPCNPTVPSGWGFPAGTISFKFLFTDTDDRQVPYLTGAPTIDGAIDPEGSSSQRLPPADRKKRTLRLLQMDIAVRDTASPTGWVFGTYVWHESRAGGGALDGLVPVGLQWGNDPGELAATRDDWVTLGQTRLNSALAGHVWRAEGQDWPQRPFPGFQGRLNGPADNKKSSCLSCHALAQWPRSERGLLASVGWNDLDGDGPAPQARRRSLVADYMTNVASGDLTMPSEANPSPTRGASRSLDYSLQVESAMSRLCSACKRGDLPGPTPTVCRVKGVPSFAYVQSETCPSAPNRFLQFFTGRPPAQPLDRQ